MSANINFAASAAASGARPTASSSTTASGKAAASSPTLAEAKPKSHMILPYEVLFNLVGRRVTVVLTRKGHELEGTLQSVDSDKGDMLLSDVVHSQWQPVKDAVEGEAEKAAEEGFHVCSGGGRRREVSRCSQAMVNSAFVALVTPTQFIPV